MKKYTLPINTLHIDIENGYGGSSRSLSYLIKNLQSKYIRPEVWVARDGPAIERNKKNGINCKLNKNISYIIPIKKKNLLNIIISLPKLFCLFKLAKDIKKNNHDLLHLNHEGLLPLAFLLKISGYKKKIILHKRSIFFVNFYSSLFLKLIKYVDGLIFISDKEKKNLFNLNKTVNIKNEVIYNSYELIDKDKVKIRKKNNYRAVYLGSFNYYKAPDRIVDLAYETSKAKLPIEYFIFGKENIRKKINKNEIDSTFLSRKIKLLGLEKIVKIKGQTKNPKKVLLNADILIRPSRRNDNWGRDIIEAMSTGKFIISTGNDNFFLTDKLNGVVVNSWNVIDLKKTIKEYINNIDKFNNIKLNAYNFALKNFNAKKNSKIAKNFFLDVFVS